MISWPGDGGQCWSGLLAPDCQMQEWRALQVRPMGSASPGTHR
jgi:hypothetical protein